MLAPAARKRSSATCVAREISESSAPLAGVDQYPTRVLASCASCNSNSLTVFQPCAQSRRSRPDMALSMRVTSSTVRAIGPTCATVPKALAGNAGTVPKVGLCPTMPQKEAGMRMEPPPSVPTCNTPAPVAAATAAPPEDPPEVISGFQGLRVMPKALLSVTAFHPISGEVVTPIKTAPFARKLLTQGASSAQGSAADVRLP